jgi:hypothetical protein
VRAKKPFFILLPPACALLVVIWSCGGLGLRNQPDLCNCSPSASSSTDYRTAAKHLLLPSQTPTEITVSDLLNFPLINPQPAFDAPRTGRELNLFHISNAFVQFVRLVGSDCDVHVEISDTPDKNAPRVIVETPRNGTYCAARLNLMLQLNKRGIVIANGGQEVNPPLPVQVVGLAFQDTPHVRGTALVATIWELHPAIVSLK